MTFSLFRDLEIATITAFLYFKNYKRIIKYHDYTNNYDKRLTYSIYQQNSLFFPCVITIITINVKCLSVIKILCIWKSFEFARGSAIHSYQCNFVFELQSGFSWKILFLSYGYYMINNHHKIYFLVVYISEVFSQI